MQSKFVIAVLIGLSLVSQCSSAFQVKSRDQLNRIMADCGKKLKIPDNLVYQVDELFKKTDQRNVLCYARCILTKMELFDSRDGILLEPLTRQLGSANQLEPILVLPRIISCAKYIEENREDLCKMAFMSTHCVHKIGLKLVKGQTF